MIAGVFDRRRDLGAAQLRRREHPLQHVDARRSDRIAALGLSLATHPIGAIAFGEHGVPALVHRQGGGDALERREVGDIDRQGTGAGRGPDRRSSAGCRSTTGRPSAMLASSVKVLDCALKSATPLNFTFRPKVMR